MPDLDRSAKVAIFRAMTTMFHCDEQFRSGISSGKFFLQYYSPRGQEAIPAGVAAALRADDYLVTTYRGLYDSLAKGVSLRDVWAEYLGRAAGPCKGKGGPMHLTDVQNGLMVTTGVVGSGLPIANGLALSSVLRGDGRVTVVNFGDGASNIGAFHEALNMASVWSLPVVFMCSNNGYGENTAFALSCRNETVAARAAGYGMPGFTVDGFDPIAVCGVVSDAVGRARDGQGPTLVEATTFRYFGHYFGDAQTYLAEGEMEAAVAKDPLPRYRARLIAEGDAGDEELTAIEDEARAAVLDAIEYAVSLAEPDVAELDIDVYAEVTA